MLWAPVQGSWGYLLGFVLMALGLYMLHKLAGGLEVAVANGAERSQGLFGQLRNGRWAQWAVAGAASPGAAGQGPVRCHLPPAGLRSATSSVRVRVRVKPLCNQQTVLHRTQANTRWDGGW